MSKANSNQYYEKQLQKTLKHIAYVYFSNYKNVTQRRMPLSKIN